MAKSEKQGAMDCAATVKVPGMMGSGDRVAIVASRCRVLKTSDRSVAGNKWATLVARETCISIMRNKFGILECVRSGVVTCALLVTSDF